jgi:flavin reductase (DIM6/NTAB) family NADH-FMN oxidoreductase RutF
MTTSIPVPTADLYRLALGRFATGVTVLTTLAGHHDHAMTANTVTSVSLEPLLVLACVEKDARFHDAILEAGMWGISILSAAQRPTADWLATQGRPLHGQLERVPHHRGTHTGVVLLDGSLATVECRTTGVFPGGDHSIVVGEVLSVGAQDHPGEALVYYRSRYTTLA